MSRFTNFNFPVSTSVVGPDNNLPTNASFLIGQIFHSTTKRVAPGLCYAGQTYNWSDNPQLKTLFDNEGHDFIINNGDTFTIVNHTDFIRAGVSNIGTYVEDSLKAHTHTYQTKPTNFGETNNGSSYFRGDGGRNNTLLNRTTGSTGSAETAPKHRTAYFGIYGDIKSITADTQDVTSLLLEDVGKVRIQSTSSFTISTTSPEGTTLAFLSQAQTNGTKRTIVGFNQDPNDSHLVCTKAATYTIDAGWLSNASSQSGFIGGILYVNKNGTWLAVHNTIGNTIELDGAGDRSCVTVNLKAHLDLEIGDRIALNYVNRTGYNASGNNLFIYIDEELEQYKILGQEVEILDEDDFASDSDKAVSTQQAVKAFITSQLSNVESLRGSPVNTIEDLKSLQAKDYEIRRVLANNRDYIYREGAIANGDNGDESGNQGSGAWIREKLPFNIKEFDALTDLDNAEVQDGEIIKILVSPDQNYLDVKLYTISTESYNGADYEFQTADGNTLYAKPVGNYNWIQELEDSGDGINNVYASYNDFFTGEHDLHLGYETYKIRRKPGATNPYIIHNVLGGNITIPADDFDWYEFQRLDIYTIKFLGKPYRSDKSLSTYKTNRQDLSSNISLSNNSEGIQHLLNKTGMVLTINLPNSPIKDTHFIVKNRIDSTDSLYINDITLLPGEMWNGIWDGVEWMEI